ncbi:hypothetical protein AM1BK_52040 [Neobacillus kokaensis]|uniref:Uncharacterized protein n=1 Tax=Neobacillus kokaensis TaxID=2759023 RepID=A0ABQ3NCM5_9BACI|nr:hypothetical protein AM1BK_52040 [Neobacillus kokaensis]
MWISNDFIVDNVENINDLRYLAILNVYKLVEKFILKVHS